MRIFKRGQATTEYLIILAVVIVIALVVIVAMGMFPALGRSKASSNMAFWSRQDIAITYYTISDTGADTFVVKNKMKNPVTITAFVIGGQDLAAADVTLSPDGTNTYTSSLTSPVTDIDCFAGQTYVLSVSISFTDQSTGEKYAFTGDGTKLEGICAD